MIPISKSRPRSSVLGWLLFLVAMTLVAGLTGCVSKKQPDPLGYAVTTHTFQDGPDVIKLEPIVSAATTQASTAMNDANELYIRTLRSSPALEAFAKKILDDLRDLHASLTSAQTIARAGDEVTDWYTKNTTYMISVVRELEGANAKWAKAYEIKAQETSQAWIEADIAIKSKDRAATRWIGIGVSFAGVAMLMFCAYLAWTTTNKTGAIFGMSIGAAGLCVGFAMILYPEKIATYGKLTLLIFAGGFAAVGVVYLWFMIRRELKTAQSQVELKSIEADNNWNAGKAIAAMKQATAGIVDPAKRLEIEEPIKSLAPVPNSLINDMIADAKSEQT